MGITRSALWDTIREVIERKDAEWDHEGDHWLRYWSPEDTEAVIQRLLAVAETNGMERERHPKYYVCAQGTDLAGYAFYKTVDDEVQEHFNADLGASATVDDVPPFLGRFTEVRR